MAEENNSYPMISEKNWWIIRDKFKSALPSICSPTYIKSLLTMSSENSANSNVIVPMKCMGLINEDNKPTDLANNWRLDNTYKEACNTIVNNIYPKELLDLCPDANVDRNIAKNWFMSRGVGETAANKMTAIFILLKNGELKEKKNPASKNNNKTIKKVNPPVNTKAEKDIVQSEITNSCPSVQTKKPNLHIDLQIHISPESSPEQIEAIFASMAKYLYGNEN